MLSSQAEDLKQKFPPDQTTLAKKKSIWRMNRSPTPLFLDARILPCPFLYSISYPLWNFVSPREKAMAFHVLPFVNWKRLSILDLHIRGGHCFFFSPEVSRRFNIWKQWFLVVVELSRKGKTIPFWERESFLCRSVLFQDYPGFSRLWKRDKACLLSVPSRAT